MPTGPIPWLEASVIVAVIGAIWAALASSPDRARRRSIAASSGALVLTIVAWMTTSFEGDGNAWLVVDELNGPLLILTALIFTLTNLATLRTKVREFSFSQSLTSEGILLATLAARPTWLIVCLLILGVMPPWVELRRLAQPTRLYVIHVSLFIGLLGLGGWLVSTGEGASLRTSVGVALLALGLLLRNGVVPMHAWMADLFERVTFGTALLFVTPMVGTYGMIRLVFPLATPGLLLTISWVSLVTAIYAGGLALVQTSGRRFFSYLFLSCSSLVLVGVGPATSLGLTGSLSLWISIALSMTGFGLVMRLVESRHGRIDLTGYLGLYHHVPAIAVLFLITGLASIGFPGTIGFVGLEILVDSSVSSLAVAGAGVVIVAALNGLAIMQAYLHIFTGRSPTTSINLRIRPAERVSVLVLVTLLIGGGIYPQSGIQLFHRSALHLSEIRSRHWPTDSHTHHHAGTPTNTPDADRH